MLFFILIYIKHCILNIIHCFYDFVFFIIELYIYTALI